MGNVYVVGAGNVTSINGVTGPVQIGGRNLILNTGSDTVLVGAKELHLGTSSWFVDKLPSLAGKSFALSFDYDATEDADTTLFFQLFYYSIDGTGHYYSVSNSINLSESKNGHEIYTNTLPTAQYNANTFVQVRASGTSGTSGSVTVKNIKFEIGTVATDWSPAPEDIFARLEALEEKTGITADLPQVEGPEIMDEPVDHAGGGNIP